MAGRVAIWSAVLLALVWWGSLVRDSAAGLASWLSPALAALVLLSWAAAVRAVGGWRSTPPRARPLRWRETGAGQGRFEDSQGRPLRVAVLADLGDAMVVRVDVPEAGLEATLHWLGAGAVPVRWRWRLYSRSKWGGQTATMMASLAPYTPQNTTLLTPPTTATNRASPGSARRKA